MLDGKTEVKSLRLNPVSTKKSPRDVLTGKKWGEVVVQGWLRLVLQGVEIKRKGLLGRQKNGGHLS